MAPPSTKQPAICAAAYTLRTSASSPQRGDRPSKALSFLSERGGRERGQLRTRPVSAPHEWRSPSELSVPPVDSLLALRDYPSRSESYWVQSAGSSHTLSSPGGPPLLPARPGSVSLHRPAAQRVAGCRPLTQWSRCALRWSP